MRNRTKIGIGIGIGTKMNDFDLQRSFKVMSAIASHSPLNISETVRDRGLVPLILNGLWGIEWSSYTWAPKFMTA